MVLNNQYSFSFLFRNHLNRLLLLIEGIAAFILVLNRNIGRFVNSLPYKTCNALSLVVFAFVILSKLIGL